MSINITDLDEKLVIQSLWASSRPNPVEPERTEITLDEIQGVLDTGIMTAETFDGVIYGRFVGQPYAPGTYDPEGYDQINGAGEAERVIDSLRLRIEHSLNRDGETINDSPDARGKA